MKPVADQNAILCGCKPGAGQNIALRVTPTARRFTFLLFIHLYVMPVLFKHEIRLFFYKCIVPMEFLPREVRVYFPGVSQLRQSRATQSTVHAGCFSVSIIYRTLIWTTGSLTCAQTLMHATVFGGVRHRTRVCTENGLGEKSLGAPGNRTCVSDVPVRRCTNWATSNPTPHPDFDVNSKWDLFVICWLFVFRSDLPVVVGCR